MTTAWVGDWESVQRCVFEEDIVRARVEYAVVSREGGRILKRDGEGGGEEDPCIPKGKATNSFVPLVTTYTIPPSAPTLGFPTIISAPVTLASTSVSFCALSPGSSAEISNVKIDVDAVTDARESSACRCRPLGLHARERMSLGYSRERSVRRVESVVVKRMLQVPVEAEP